MDKEHEIMGNVGGTVADSERGTIEFKRNEQGQTFVQGTVNPGFEARASDFNVTIAPVQPRPFQGDELPERTRTLFSLAQKWVNRIEEKNYDMVQFLEDETGTWEFPVKEKTFQEALQRARDARIIGYNEKTNRYIPLEKPA